MNSVGMPADEAGGRDLQHYWESRGHVCMYVVVRRRSTSRGD